MLKLNKATFNSSGSWTCPSGVTTVIVWGMGGGASGCGGGSNSNYGKGGVGQHLQAVVLDVVPNTTYTITIGAGGAATSSILGNAGGDTSFGALMTWAGAPNRLPVTGGDAFGVFRYSVIVTATNQVAYAAPGESNPTPLYGYSSRSGLSAAPGTNAGSYFGGGSGMGGEGIGGTGGNAVASGTGSAGGNAASNSGAGGGAGGGGTLVSSGGAGGSGQLIITWVE